MEIMFGHPKEAEANFQRSYELNRRFRRLEDTCLLGNMASWCIYIGKPDRGWRMLNRAKRILDSIKGSLASNSQDGVYSQHGIILNIREQHSLALPYARLN